MNDDASRAMADFVESLSDGQAVRFDARGDELILRQYSFTELGRLPGSGESIALMGPEAMPGVRYLTRSLELRHFPPGTPRNDLLHVYLLRWCGTLWSLVLFPWYALSPRETHAVVKAAGLRAVRGLPLCGGDVDPLGPGNRPAGHAQAFAAGYCQPDLDLGHVRVLQITAGHPLCRSGPEAEALLDEMLESLEAAWRAGR
jgi:hypothetical protein